MIFNDSDILTSLWLDLLNNRYVIVKLFAQVFKYVFHFFPDVSIANTYSYLLSIFVHQNQKFSSDCSIQVSHVLFMKYFEFFKNGPYCQGHKGRYYLMVRWTKFANGRFRKSCPIPSEHIISHNRTRQIWMGSLCWFFRNILQSSMVKNFCKCSKYQAMPEYLEILYCKFKVVKHFINDKKIEGISSFSIENLEIMVYITLKNLKKFGIYLETK